MNDALEAQRAIRLKQKIAERRAWAEYQRTYERCKAIAEAVWQKDLDDASAQQQALAEAMRDRTSGPADPAVLMFAPREASIHAPLFTPRDRLQFLKEATTNLMIGTERRGLTVTPEVKDVETEKAPEAQPVEAASGADETGDPADAPLALAQEGNYGERVSEAPTPRV